MFRSSSFCHMHTLAAFPTPRFTGKRQRHVWVQYFSWCLNVSHKENWVFLFSLVLEVGICSSNMEQEGHTLESMKARHIVKRRILPRSITSSLKLALFLQGVDENNDRVFKNEGTRFKVMCRDHEVLILILSVFHKKLTSLFHYSAHHLSLSLPLSIHLSQAWIAQCNSKSPVGIAYFSFMKVLHRRSLVTEH